MNILVIYYSRTGTTGKIARCIAEEIGCEHEAIVDTVSRNGVIGFMRSIGSVMRKNLTNIEEMDHDPPQYDLVIIGTPIWAGRVSAPVRTFIHQHKDSLKTAAFFATHGKNDPQNAFREMVEICGKEPVAVLNLKDEKVLKGNYTGAVKKFVRELSQ